MILKKSLYKIIFIFFFLFNFIFIYTYSFCTNQTLSLNTRSCIVLDRLSSTILFEKNCYNKVKMASTTKIMSCIVILENFDLSKTVEVSKKAANTGGSRLGLKTGDKITIHDLLYGLMLCSGNDAAICLAESYSENVSSFCELMNQKALELNLSNTHFESPHGLDSDNHYTTAYELAILTNYALNNPTFLKIVGTKNYTITINGYPKNLNNTNELLGSLNGIYGVKTGFTNGANRCLVTACKRNDMDIICIVLGCDTKKFRTQDSIKLIENTFENYEYINIEEKINLEFDNWKNDYLASLNINKGLYNDFLDIKISNLETPILPIKKELINDIKIKFTANLNFNAPIYANDKLGYIEIFAGDELIETCSIIANESVKHKNIFDYLYDFLYNFKRNAFAFPFYFTFSFM